MALGFLINVPIAIVVFTRDTPECARARHSVGRFDFAGGASGRRRRQLLMGVWRFGERKNWLIQAALIAAGIILLHLCLA